jgi:hypothetical protein
VTDSQTPAHWLWLDWYELITEPDPWAPRSEPGEPQPTRQRYLHYGRRLTASSVTTAERIRHWHETHDSWIPAYACGFDNPLFAPNVSEVYGRITGGTR